jgi:hypothetical protein
MQILTRVWKYNKMKGNADGDVDDDDEYDAEASKIQVASVMDSLYRFPLRIPSKGEVYVFLGSPITMISHPIARGERACRDEATDQWNHIK